MSEAGYVLGQSERAARRLELQDRHFAVPSEAPTERGSSYRLRDFDADREDHGPQWAGEPPRGPEQGQNQPEKTKKGTSRHTGDSSRFLAVGQGGTMQRVFR